MRLLPISLLLAAVTACSAAPQAPASDPALEARARAIHDRVIALDTHVDIDPSNFTTAAPNYATGLEGTQVDIPSMERGGLDAAFFSIYQGQQPDFTPEGYARAHATALAKVEAVHRLVTELAPERIGLAATAADVRRLQAEGKLVALMGMENGYALGEDVDNVRKFAQQGVRYLSLAHNGHSQLADSNTGEADGYRWGGLSPLGRRVVEEANRWGIVLDISHPSKDANLQTMALSRAPVMASHSAVRALADHSRNLDDEQLLALKENGGVVQIVAFSAYLDTTPPTPERQAALAALRQEFGATGGSIRAAMRAMTDERRAEFRRRLDALDLQFPPPPRASIEDLVDHIDYAVRLIGIDHVGISSDFDGGGGIEGWSDATETPNVTLELVRRGYTEDQIAKIWSGNVLRVLEQAERVAAELRGRSTP